MKSRPEGFWRWLLSLILYQLLGFIVWALFYWAVVIYKMPGQRIIIAGVTVSILVVGLFVIDYVHNRKEKL